MDSRSAFLGVDQVGHFEVQCEVGLVVLGLAGIAYRKLYVRKRFLLLLLVHSRMVRCRGDKPASA